MASKQSQEPALAQAIESFQHDVKVLRGEAELPETPEVPLGGFASLQAARQLRTRFVETRQQLQTARVQQLEAQSRKIARPVKERKEQVEKSDKQRRKEITAPAEGKYVVAGRFLEVNTGNPLPGLRIQVMERDPGSDDLLGEVRTDRYGFYRLEYTDEDFHGSVDKKPETFVRVLDESDNIVYTSDQSFRHKAGAAEVIDGAVDGEKVPESATMGKQFSESKSDEGDRLERQVTYLENRAKIRTDPMALLRADEETNNDLVSE
jgi:hypothetical protein